MKPLYSKKKRGAHKRYSASVRAELGRYASHHGVAASSSLFFKEASLSNSCLPDFTINVIATNTQSSSVLVHLVFVHDKFSLR